MKEKQLNNNLKECKINILNADINVYSANIPNPIVKYNGNFDVIDNYSILTIKQSLEKSKNGFNFKKIFGRQVVVIDGCKIIKRGNSTTVLGNGGNVTQINGRTFINGIEITDDMFRDSNNYSRDEKIIGSPSVDLIFPSDHNNISLDLNLTSGDIDLSNLILDRLIINNKNGDINLKDLDAILTKIQLINGDIKAEIAESMMNYVISSNTINGSANQRTIESFDAIPNLLNQKHSLNINNINGDIDIIFKGKSKKR